MYRRKIFAAELREILAMIHFQKTRKIIKLWKHF